MDLFDVIKKRRSIRKYTSDDVSQDKIEKMIKAAHLAPSGNNTKNWHFIIVRDEATKQKMLEDIKNRIDDLISCMRSKRAKDDFLVYTDYFTFFVSAPVVVAVVKKPYDSLSVRIIKRYNKNTTAFSDAGLQNVSAAIENMLLAAVALDLGACWMTGPMIAKEALEKTLGISEDNDLVALIPVGVPDYAANAHEFPEDLSEVMTVV